MCHGQPILTLCLLLQMLQMVTRYERSAKLRAERTGTEFDDALADAFQQLDAVLGEAEMASLPSVFYDVRIRRLICLGGLSIEFRRCVRVPCDRDAASDAYTQFFPPHISQQFVFEDVTEREFLCLGWESSNALCWL